MKILALGDVTGSIAISYLQKHLWQKRSALGVDFVVANGENASEIHGVTASDARALLDLGIDLITMGNHTYKKRGIEELLESGEPIIRPANYPAACPGVGYKIMNINGYRILCMSVLGVVYLEPLASPFETVDKILEREGGNFDFSLLDFHAEATSEKMAAARYFDGRVNIIFGTHTHVQTADEQVLPGGSGYITDLGMSGPVSGILGTATRPVLDRFLTKMPQRFTVADGEVAVCGALFELDTAGASVTAVTRVKF